MQAESVENSGRLHELVRRRWNKLDWKASLPGDRLVITESHYMDVEALGLSNSQRQQLNRLFACFSCELFIHFERYLIEFLQRRRADIKTLQKPALDRFVAEEIAHSEAFLRLLRMLRPDLYSDRATITTGLRFMSWSRQDDLAIALAPVSSFFLLSWLFEEITLFVPVALDKNPEQCAPLIAEIMKLHAKEEQPHVAIDARVLHLESRGRPRWLRAAETLLALPLLAFAGHRSQCGWKLAVDLAESEFGLTPPQRQRLLNRGPSQSDRMGIASFADKMDQSDVPAGSFLAGLLRRQLRQAP